MTDLVVDSSAVVGALATERGFEVFGERKLFAPRLMWSEVSAVVHAMVWREAISREAGETVLERLITCPIAIGDPPGLIASSWRFADQLGWARTYDAEYLALAMHLNCKVVTIDLRLRRGAERTGLVVTPQEIADLAP